MARRWEPLAAGGGGVRGASGGGAGEEEEASRGPQSPTHRGLTGYLHLLLYI